MKKTFLLYVLHKMEHLEVNQQQNILHNTNPSGLIISLTSQFLYILHNNEEKKDLQITIHTSFKPKCTQNFSLYLSHNYHQQSKAFFKQLSLNKLNIPILIHEFPTWILTNELKIKSKTRVKLLNTHTCLNTQLKISTHFQ